MQIQASIALQAALKSLADVVLPAVDGGNKLAQEQGQLVLALLGLVAQRLPLQFDYDLDELKRLIALAQRLQGLGHGEGLAEPLSGSAATLQRASASPKAVSDAIGALRAAIGRVSAGLASDGSDNGRAAFRAVLDASQEQQLRERSWLLPQGWEVDPSSIPDIRQLIDTESAR